MAIEIGKEIGGEIISADAMQVYKGLDIITNKVTKEEQAMIPHHMIDVVESNVKFSVMQFKRMALSIANDIFKRQKIPIIVGGTNYYIESLLWDNLIEETTLTNETCTKSQEMENVKLTDKDVEHMSRKDDTTSDFSSELSGVPGSGEQLGSQSPLYQKLVEIDPVEASKLHPNDTRKIMRSLQVYERCGIIHSELKSQQQKQVGATVYGGPMRFKNVCILWLQCDREILDERLDARVDKMLEQGLVEELLAFHNSWKSDSADVKTQVTEGIFQSIGYKELQEFLNSENPVDQKSGELFHKCLESIKSATRRYSRKQIKWITNRFLGRPTTCAPDVYGLDATDLGKWESCVLEKALNIVRKLMVGEKVPDEALNRVNSNAASKHSRHICAVCNDRTIIGDKNWTVHLHSRSHRHYKKKAKRSEAKT